MIFQALVKKEAKPMADDACKADEVAGIINGLRHLDGACLPVLHAIQAKFGHVPDDAVAQVAEALNLSRAEVHGVVSFYKDFTKVPPGRHTLRVCCADSCQAAGGGEVLDAIRSHLGIGFGETTADGKITLQPVFCLGNCALSPALTLDGRIVGRADAAKALGMIDACRSQTAK